MVKIKNIAHGSLADMCGIKSNDTLLSVNGHEINDVLDYKFYLAEQKIKIKIRRDEEEIEFDISKDIYDDIGLDFETPLMDNKHRCENKCIFCFIDQLPKGLRETLYFKDDDSRLSFLHGNYITLTNLEKKDIERIIEMHISPVNVSIHTTNPELRCKMMHNKRAGEVLDYLKILADNGIEICGQIVLCKGVNDGDELEKTLNDSAKLFPSLRSMCVVPSGLTSYREGLYHLEPFYKNDCIKVIKQVERINDKYKKLYHKSLFFCSDEFYLTANKKMPSDKYYEDYSQIENGVGMIRSFEYEAKTFLKTLSNKERSISRKISIATGVSAYDFICDLVKKVQRKCKNLECKVYKIENDFFGHTITVSGLVTAVDMLKQLKGKDLGDELLISGNMLRAEGDLFLCGTSLEEFSREIGVKVVTVKSDGGNFVEALLGIKEV